MTARTIGHARGTSGIYHAWLAQVMKQLQPDLLTAPFVILAVALFLLWLFRPRNRPHPGE